MPNDYVSDYEQLTGRKPVVETKVITAPETPAPAATVAEVK